MKNVAPLWPISWEPRIFAGICGFGLLLRFFGLSNDLWFDEIWRLTILGNLHTPLDLYRLHGVIGLDGHSSLYTIYTWLCGPEASSLGLRFLSFLASLGSFIGLSHLLRKSPTMERYTVATLFSFSYLFVLYGSEARGYSVMVCCALLAYLALQRAHVQKPGRGDLLFGVLVVLGFFFHYSMVQFYVACILWSIAALRQKFKGSFFFRRLLALHSFPLFVISAMYLGIIRFFPPGTGPLSSYLEVIVSTLSVSFGGDLFSPYSSHVVCLVLVPATIVFCLLSFELLMEFKEGREDAWFFAAVIFVVPAIILMLLSPRIVAVRYFLLSALFSYFLAGRLFQRLWSASIIGKVLCAILLLFSLLGQGRYLLEFSKFGRGQYQNALNWIRSETGAGTIRIGGDFDFRNHMVVEYYSKNKNMEYVDNAGQVTEPMVEWYLAQSQDRSFEPSPFLEIGKQGRYVLKKEFPYTALSGWSWYVYKREA